MTITLLLVQLTVLSAQAGTEPFDYFASQAASADSAYVAIHATRLDSPERYVIRLEAQPNGRGRIVADGFGIDATRWYWDGKQTFTKASLASAPAELDGWATTTAGIWSEARGGFKNTTVVERQPANLPGSWDRWTWYEVDLPFAPPLQGDMYFGFMSGAPYTLRGIAFRNGTQPMADLRVDAFEWNVPIRKEIFDSAPGSEGPLYPPPAWRPGPSTIPMPPELAGRVSSDGRTLVGDLPADLWHREDFVGKKVTICHRPPGNPNNGKTIEINEHAWPAHEAGHGDTMGPCPPGGSGPTTPPDGDTIDSSGCAGCQSGLGGGSRLGFSWLLLLVMVRRRAGQRHTH